MRNEKTDGDKLASIIIIYRVFFEQITQNPVYYSKNCTNLLKQFGDDPDNYELNGKKIFKNLDDRQKGRANKVLGPLKKSGSDIAATAAKIAESMQCDTADELLSITEIVMAEVKGTHVH